MIEMTDLAKFKKRTEKSIRQLAFVEAKKDHGQELMNILFNTIVEPTRREEGNIAFVPHFSIDNPDEILFDEIWIDRKV
jgi:quinol monooxygenase YgiN